MITNRISQGRSLARSLSQNPQKGPNIAFFTGGTGSRFLAMKMAQYSYNTSHIINVADSGGSTRQLRLLFNMPAIGDFRSRLVDLSDRSSPGHKEITEFMMHRIGKEGKTEYKKLLSGEHELIKSIEESHAEKSRMWLNIIKRSLLEFEVNRTTFEQKKGMEFNFTGASLGNIFLTGTYFLYGNDLPTAIDFYEMIANVRGRVIPATTDNVHLAATMADGSTLVAQHLISHAKNGPVHDLWYVDSETETEAEVSRINPIMFEGVRSAIREAKLLVYSMSSLFTSLLSTLQIKEIAKLIRESNVPKVFLVNGYQDEETVGMSASDMVNQLLEILKINDGNTNDNRYLTAVIGNTLCQSGAGLDFTNFDDSRIRREHPGIETYGTELLSEDPKKFDSEKLAMILLSYLQK